MLGARIIHLVVAMRLPHPSGDSTVCPGATTHGEGCGWQIRSSGGGQTPTMS